jgi:hypothetical protein
MRLIIGKWIVTLGLISAILLLLNSCDQEHIKDFYVANKYADSLTVNFKVFNDKLGKEIINLNDTILVYSDVYVMGTVGVDDNRNELAITEMTIENKGEKLIVQKGDWNYNEIGKFHAKYYLKVDSTLFKRGK